MYTTTISNRETILDKVDSEILPHSFLEQLFSRYGEEKKRGYRLGQKYRSTQSSRTVHLLMLRKEEKRVESGQGYDSGINGSPSATTAALGRLFSTNIWK